MAGIPAGHSDLWRHRIFAMILRLSTLDCFRRSDCRRRLK
jgi:hypothetical protein